jgi:hypothetical protein
VTANSANPTYSGQAQSVTGFTATGLVNSQTIAVLTGVTASGATGTNAGTYTNTVSGTDSNYNLTLVNGALTIAKANATVTGNGANVTYNGNDQSVTGFTASGLVNGESAAVLTGVTASGATGKNYGSYTNTVSGTDSNYNLTLVNGTLAIAKAGLAVVGANSNATYTGQAQTNSAATVTGAQGTDSFTVAGYGSGTNASATAYADNLVATAAGSTLATNYTISYTNGGITIGKAGLTVTADNKTKVYGDSNPALTYTITGYVNGESASVITGAPTISTTASTTTNVGTATITAAANNLAATNYSFSYANGSLSITAAPLTITGANSSVTYSGVAQTNSAATITGLKNSNSFTITGYGVGTNASATAYADTLVATPVSGTQATNYNITITNGGITIGKATLAITGTQAYNGTTTFNASNLVASGVNGETFSLTGSADLSTKNVQTNQRLLNINGLTLTPAGVASFANYEAVTTANTTISVTALPISLSAPTITKVYDGGYTYNVTSADLGNMSAQLVGGDSVTSASVSFASSAAGTNKQVNLLSAAINDGNNGANYNVSLASSNTSVISKAALNISATNDAKFVTIADTVGFAGAIINGFVNGETPANLTGSLSITRTNASQNGAGNYVGVLQPSGYTSSNYSITYNNGNFTIVPAQTLLIRVTSGIAGNFANPATVNYGSAPSYHITAQYLPLSGPAVNLTPINNGLITINDGAGSSVSFALSAANAVMSRAGYLSVGAYNLVNTATNITGQNFLSMMVVGSLTVTPLQLTSGDLGVAGITKVYNGSAAISAIAPNINQLSSAILANDSVAISATGQFNNQNVGVNKQVSINLSLSGADAGNYSLSNTQVTGNIGTITQLASVTYVGATGGNWSNAANWAGGAIPTLSNVANVIIPNGITVNYDSVAVGQVGSTINNSGVINFTGGNNFTFANAVSGSGSISLSGAGITTISGNNTYSGGTNINASKLLIGSTNALGSGSITSNGGSIALDPAITIPSLILTGPVTLSSDIHTLGNQTYNGTVTLGAGNAVGGVVTPMLLKSDNGNIAFNGRLQADASSFANKQSLDIEALNGQVVFNDTVGASTTNPDGSRVLFSSAYFQGPNIYNLNVKANTILTKADITTFANQAYWGHVLIGDNGSNGMTRIMLSEDPSVVFNGAVDDVTPNTHHLVVEAITTSIPANASEMPFIQFIGNVGDLNPLAMLTVRTGYQNQNMADVPAIAQTTTNIGRIEHAEIITYGTQSFVSDSAGDASRRHEVSVPSTTVFQPVEAITAGVLQMTFNGPKDFDLLLIIGKQSSGSSVSVTSPENNCKSEDGCAAIQSL